MNVARLVAEPLTIGLDGLVLAQPCLRVVLFGEEVEGGAGLAAPFDAFVGRFGNAIGWYFDGFHQSAPKRYAKAAAGGTLERLRHEVTGPRGAVAQFSAPSLKGECLAPAFHYWKSGKASRAIAVLSLPMSWSEEAASHGIPSLLSDVVDGGFPLATGYVGPSILWNHSLMQSKAVLAPWFRKWFIDNPGLMHPTPFAEAHLASHGVVDIGWYTLLGAKTTGALGAPESVLARIDPGHRASIGVHRYSSGAVAFRAGETTGLEHIGPDGHAVLQRAVGKALGGLCTSPSNDDAALPDFSQPSAENPLRGWPRRFFDF